MGVGPHMLFCFAVINLLLMNAFVKIPGLSKDVAPFLAELTLLFVLLYCTVIGCTSGVTSVYHCQRMELRRVNTWMASYKPFTPFRKAPTRDLLRVIHLGVCM